MRTPSPLDPPVAPSLPVTDRTRVRRHPERQLPDRAALRAVLDDALVAHVAVVRDGEPLVLPVACARDGERLLLHGSSGAGLLRLAVGARVCVAVTRLDGLVFAESAFASSMNYASVVVHGVAEAVEEPAAKRAAVHAVTEHLMPGRWDEVAQPTAKELAATLVLAVPLREASLKQRGGGAAPWEGERPEDAAWTGVLPLRLVAGTPVAADEVPAGLAVSPSVRNASARWAPPGAAPGERT